VDSRYWHIDFWLTDWFFGAIIYTYTDKQGA
jgi:hypothetical protein